MNQISVKTSFKCQHKNRKYKCIEFQALLISNNYAYTLNYIILGTMKIKPKWSPISFVLAIHIEGSSRKVFFLFLNKASYNFLWLFLI